MSVPKKRLPSKKVRSRRAHHALTITKLTICPKCKKKTLPHKACSFCGYYKGQEVLSVEKRLAKKRTKAEQRRKDKEESRKEAAQTKTTKKSPNKKSEPEAKKVTV